jgi:hypothetical protein
MNSEKGMVYGKFKNKTLTYSLNDEDNIFCKKDIIDKIYQSAYKEGMDLFVEVSQIKLNDEFISKFDLESLEYSSSVKGVKYKKRKYDDVLKTLDGKKICPPDKLAKIYCKGFKDGTESIMNMISNEMGIDINNNKYDYKCKLNKMNEDKMNIEIKYGVLNHGK